MKKLASKSLEAMKTNVINSVLVSIAFLLIFGCASGATNSLS